ncbi:MAG: hypothetical protein IT373_03230, partial [Polyangiaceae bacterium]|nr:hypothetical protein [Polyangiaceae bacterium]
ALVCSDATGSTVDLCNGSDDDCDAASADGSEDPQNGTQCDGADSDLCLEGTRSCSAGSLVCSDATGSTTDTCNGLDDDCDAASADGSEDPLNGTACDGADTDLCNEGTRSCPAGSLVCSDATGNTVEVCNGLDDDCDTLVDEDGVCSTCGATCYYYTGSCSSSYIGSCDGCDMGCGVHDPDCDGSPCMSACPCLAGLSHWYCDGWNDCADPACECAGE